jgi:hypothetical protein
MGSFVEKSVCYGLKDCFDAHDYVVMLARAAELRAVGVGSILTARRFCTIVEEHIKIDFVLHCVHDCIAV